jgi:hypothetical protein
MKREAQRQLFQALKAHKFELEITRGVALGLDRNVLDGRIEAARLLLEWLSQDPGLDRPASQAVRMPTSSKGPTGSNFIRPKDAKGSEPPPR